MSALRRNIEEDGAEETLDAVVARIKASGRDHTLPTPSRDAVNRFIARVAEEPSMSEEELSAWNETWAHIIGDIHRRDREDDIAEGRG